MDLHRLVPLVAFALNVTLGADTGYDAGPFLVDPGSGSLLVNPGSGSISRPLDR